MDTFGIPHKIDDVGLSAFAYRLYAHLKRRYDNEMRQDVPAVGYLSSVCGMSHGQVVNSLNELADCGLVVGVVGLPAHVAADICMTKTPQQASTPLYDKTCEWCTCKTRILHRHHYPVPKSEGGTETVSICPNCHAEFHDMVANWRRFCPFGKQD